MDCKYQNICILLIGESGSGKTTLSEALATQYGFTILSSYTDRPKRYSEEIGHTFISKEAFDNIRAAQHMVAYNLFNGYDYGATQEQVEASQIYTIDVPGYFRLMEEYVGLKVFVPFYLYVPEYERKHRMLKRGDPVTKVIGRIAYDQKAFADIATIPYYLLDGQKTIATLSETVIQLIDRWIADPSANSLHASCSTATKALYLNKYFN